MNTQTHGSDITTNVPIPRIENSGRRDLQRNSPSSILTYTSEQLLQSEWANSLSIAPFARMMFLICWHAHKKVVAVCVGQSWSPPDTVHVTARCALHVLFLYSGVSLIWRMVSSGMLRRVALVRTDVSEELSASFIRATRIGENLKSYILRTCSYCGKGNSYRRSWTKFSSITRRNLASMFVAMNNFVS
jgi:hypothetical protein